MENALSVGLSRQLALRREMQVVANNLANANTSGFKAESIVFHPDYKPDHGDAIEDVRPIAYVADFGLSRNTTEGEFTLTNNPFDVAVSGDAYLVVQTPDGNRYTRNGHLRVSPTGQIETSDGYAVLDEAGRPIQLDPTDAAPTVANDGTISGENGRIGRFQVVAFADDTRLERQGNSLLSTDQPPTPAKGIKIIQGMLESSNVQPIVEMTRMIDVLRAYQANATLMQANGDLIRRAVDNLGNVRA